MINLDLMGDISPIFLTIMLIIYLIIVELGNKRIRNALLPFIIILTIAFLIIAITSVYSTYTGLR